MRWFLATLLLTASFNTAYSDGSVTRWIGKYPFDVFEESDERTRFRGIMTAAELKTFMTATSVAGPITSDGRYVLAEGCWPRSCDTRAGFFAIEIATGKTVAVLLFDGKRTIYGAADDQVPRSLAELIRAYLRRVRS